MLIKQFIDQDKGFVDHTKERNKGASAYLKNDSSDTAILTQRDNLCYFIALLMLKEDAY